MGYHAEMDGSIKPRDEAAAKEIETALIMGRYRRTSKTLCAISG